LLPLGNQQASSRRPTGELCGIRLAGAAVAGLDSRGFAYFRRRESVCPADCAGWLIEKRAKVKKKTARALTAEQVLDFLGKLDADEEAQLRDLPDLIRYFLATGEWARPWAPTGSDFDEEARELRMTGNLIQPRKRGAVRNDGKSENAQRRIPLPEWCVTMLIERRRRLGVDAADMDTPIVRNTQGGYWNASNLNNRYWLPFRKRAGYEWVTFHTFRKTVATMLA
jgi:integrase